MTGVKSTTVQKKLVFLILLCTMVCSSCTPVCTSFDPHITYNPHVCALKDLPEGFPELTEKELFSTWGKELLIGQSFLKDNDLFRAITALKRAKYLVPNKAHERRLQIEYTILLAYYLGNKHKEVTEHFEDSALFYASPDEFPLYDDLLVMLYDSYMQTGKCEKGEMVLEMIRERTPETATSLELYQTLSRGEICASYLLVEQLPNGEAVSDYLDCYRYFEKSPKTARQLNALLPGAGYYYVGQKKTALTSFVINALFIGAAWAFFENKNIPAGLITLSFEAGWYFGGINGAGLAAKEYNERLYTENTKEMMFQQHLFPIFYFQKSF